MIERVESVYLYDATRHIHLCELTPSLRLIHVETRAVYTDAATDKQKDMLDAIIQEHAHREDVYMHVRTVERIDAGLKHHYGMAAAVVVDEGEGEDAYEHDEAGVLEHVRCNTCI